MATVIRHNNYDDLLDADARLYRDIFAHEADAWFDSLQQQLDWRTESIKIYGKTSLVPRLTAFYGDPDIGYRYSGIVHSAQPWHPLLADIRGRLKQLLDFSFNSVLANYYRDGTDTMGWHSDDEPELQGSPEIASLSLGTERPFYLRHKESVYEPYHISLPPGSLLVMGRSTQKTWQHSLPRRVGIKTPRINLTFRSIHQLRADN
jgi:alkylated DNA repair dioxygenase AlkB